MVGIDALYSDILCHICRFISDTRAFVHLNKHVYDSTRTWREMCKSVRYLYANKRCLVPSVRDLVEKETMGHRIGRLLTLKRFLSGPCARMPCTNFFDVFSLLYAKRTHIIRITVSEGLHITLVGYQSGNTQLYACYAGVRTSDLSTLIYVAVKTNFVYYTRRFYALNTRTRDVVHELLYGCACTTLCELRRGRCIMCSSTLSCPCRTACGLSLGLAHVNPGLGKVCHRRYQTARRKLIFSDRNGTPRMHYSAGLEKELNKLNM